MIIDFEDIPNVSVVGVSDKEDILTYVGNTVLEQDEFSIINFLGIPVSALLSKITSQLLEDGKKVNIFPKQLGKKEDANAALLKMNFDGAQIFDSRAPLFNQMDTYRFGNEEEKELVVVQTDVLAMGALVKGIDCTYHGQSQDAKILRSGTPLNPTILSKKGLHLFDAARIVQLHGNSHDQLQEALATQLESLLKTINGVHYQYA